MTIKKNDKIINKYFKDKYVKSRVYIKKIDETRNYLLEEIKLNDLMSKKHNKTYNYLNCVEHWLSLALKIVECVSIFAFALLVCVPVGTASSAV